MIGKYHLPQEGVTGRAPAIFYVNLTMRQILRGMQCKFSIYYGV